jgi:serine/threonine-protein kinase
LGRYAIAGLALETSAFSLYDAYDPQEKRSLFLGIPRSPDAQMPPASSSIGHPGWITVLRSEEIDGVPCVAMSHFEGKPLEQAVPGGARLTFSEVAKIAGQMGHALDYAHSRGSIHGSLCPSDVLVSVRREIRLLPSGMGAKPENLLRAVNYLSPERLCGAATDGRSDQFSLAVIAHRLLTGELPFPSNSPVGAMFRVAFHAIETSSMRTLPPAARMVLERSLARNPEQRYGSCGEMAEALEAALTERMAASPTREVDSPVPDAIPRGNSEPRFSVARAEDRPNNQRWFGRHAESLKIFGTAFAICVAVLSAGLYFFLEIHPGAGIRKAPAPAHSVAAGQGAQTVSKPEPAQKRARDVELKPAEPGVTP